MLKKTKANVYLSLSLNSLPIFKEVFGKSGVAVFLKARISLPSKYLRVQSQQ